MTVKCNMQYSCYSDITLHSWKPEKKKDIRNFFFSYKMGGGNRK